MVLVRIFRRTLSVLMVLIMCLGMTPVYNQFKSHQKSSRQNKAKRPVDELTKLREEYVNASKEYRASLEKLLVIYEASARKAEERVTQSKKLFSEGLIARASVEESEHALDVEKAKVADVQRQMSTADAQIANVLIESQADEQIAKGLRVAKGGLARTTSYIRFNGSAAWSLSDAWKVQQFFSQSFHKQLPVAVFGQGAIHDRWRLDHHNSMDVSLHPDSLEGQALLGFLQRSGIPFLAFRGAIPGTATGPHIHIGRPSHRY